MTYHLARVLHWQQDRSVALYATNIERQLHLTPGGEYGILRLDLLSGGDRLDNRPQWLAAMGSLPVVSLIPARLDATAPRAGARRGLLRHPADGDPPVLQHPERLPGRLLAGLPGRLVVGADRAGWTWALAVGAALGLATFTKATAYVFALPFLVLLAVRLLRNAGGVGRLAAVAALAGVVAVGLNAGQFARNQDLHGTPFGPDGEGAPHEIKYLNAAFGGPQLASNLLRNSTLQVATPVGSVNRAMERSVDRVHQTLGIDPNDPGTTYGQTRYPVRQTSNGEDTAGNPLHVALLVTVAAVGASGGWRHSPLAPYLLCLVAGFLLFSLLLRGSRGTAG